MVARVQHLLPNGSALSNPSEEFQQKLKESRQKRDQSSKSLIEIPMIIDQEENQSPISETNLKAPIANTANSAKPATTIINKSNNNKPVTNKSMNPSKQNNEDRRSSKSNVTR